MNDRDLYIYKEKDIYSQQYGDPPGMYDVCTEEIYKTFIND